MPALYPRLEPATLIHMGNDDLGIQVSCYAGHQGEETPRQFRIGARRVQVEEVLDRWLSPGERYFKVRGADACIYILRNDVRADRWEITLFDSGRLHETRLSST